MWLPILGIVIAVAIVVLFVAKKKGAGGPAKMFDGSALSMVRKGGVLACPLIKRTQISHDSFIFEYGLPKPDQVLGIQVGEHIVIKQFLKSHESPEGAEVYRKYTPTSPVTQRGSFDLLIKVYRSNVHPKFPEGGVMTPWLEKMKLGENIEIQGPKGKLQYQGLGRVNIAKDEQKVSRSFRQIAMVAGGTGITPMYQIIRWVADHPEEKTELFLIFANKTEPDILMKQELDHMAERGIVKLFYTLDAPPAGWKGYSGFVNEEMFKKSFPAPSNDVLCVTCGPGPMNKLALGLFEQMGYKKEYTFKF